MAGDHMHGMAAEKLLGWILSDLKKGSALGIESGLFFTPQAADPFRLQRYGVTLETPLGVAAGPHTQMAQNIIAAWLTGSRYIELKTVQVLDTITVTKPCIDMADEGYNCEWSQEFTLDQSYDEYLKAWVILHILNDHLGGQGKPGMIFNMSAGYSMEGILSPTVQRFLDRMGDCAADVAGLKKRLAPFYPRVLELDIPGRMSDNLTISCMHGCPPEEVEKIALYFIEQRGYNTTLKMNPTLLGKGYVRGILNKTLGYATEIPDIAFEHDLPYEKALGILRNCMAAAQKSGVAFSVKLTNTLESLNGGSLPGNEKMVYMSGKALHPISIALAARLQKEFGGGLDISFCAGLDSMNVAEALACGLAPLTVCSDILKPGGYGRLAKYLKSISEAMSAAGAASIDDFIRKKAGVDDLKTAMQKNLDAYAEAVTAPGSRYAKKAAKAPRAKECLAPDITMAQGEPLQNAVEALSCKKPCGICIGVCPNRANWYLAVPAAFKEAFGQERIVFNLGDFCNECGNCATFCPHYLPYRDKPRLHLSESSFNADERGFYRESPQKMRVKIKGKEYSLSRQGSDFIFENGARLSKFNMDNLAAAPAAALMSAIVFMALEENKFAEAE